MRLALKLWAAASRAASASATASSVIVIRFMVLALLTRSEPGGTGPPGVIFSE
jgi:hypothetical protein